MPTLRISDKPTDTKPLECDRGKLLEIKPSNAGYNSATK